nr:putative replicase P1 protein [Carrot associated RNA virus 1]
MSSGSSGTPSPTRNRTVMSSGRHSSWSATSGASSSPPRNDPSVVGSRLVSVIGPSGQVNNPGLWDDLIIRFERVIKAIYDSIMRVVELILSIFRRTGHIEAPTNESLIRSFDFGGNKSTSFYTKMFPGMKLNCHRELIFWVGKYCDEAADILDAVLPTDGPVVSVDLAYLIAGLVLQYDLKNMMLPSVYEVSVLGAKFLHFNKNSLVHVKLLVVQLFNFNGYVGAGLDPMHMINTAAAVGAATIASNQASTMFRMQLDQMVEVQIMLTEEEEEWVRRDRSQVYFSKSREVSHDHPYLAACREIIRTDFDRTYNMKTTDISTLVLGSGSREYKQYHNNASISFQFAGLEGKDSERILLECLKSVKSLRLKKIKKAKTKASSDLNLQKLQTVDEVMNEFKETRKLPDRIVLWQDTKDMLAGKLKKNYGVLIFQDVGYNFSKDDWASLFRHTGAFMAYGYMCLPWELLYPDSVAPPGYVYKVRGDTSYMGYHGYSNGYVHKTTTWKTLMSNVLLKCGDFNIGIEFMSRVGPMTLIKLFRCQTEEYVARHLELPDHLKSVMVLDVHDSYDRLRHKLDISNLVYFPVRAAEFNETVNYGLDISKDSLTFTNILLYVRRRTSGVSLVSKGLAKSWTIAEAKIPPFSMVVLLYVRFLTQEYLNIQTQAESTKFTVAGQLLLNYGKTVRGSIKSFLDLFRTRDTFPLLVKHVDHSVWQESASKLLSFRKKDTMLNVGPSVDPFMDDKFGMKEADEEEDETVCSFCEELKEVTGEQLFTCQREKDEEVFHTFTLTSTELNKLRTTLGDTSKDPVGLKSVKETAARFVPLSSFEHRTRVKYICGPPGTGKSHIIRSLANSQSLVLVPFARLKSDYTNFIHPITKKKASLKVMTQHAAFTALNHSRVFVDEYTAMPYEFLAVIAYNCGADEVIFVGDHRQTSLINEVEGISIESKITMSDIRSHELIKNFRNPSDAVNVLNRNYGYSMLATNKKKGFKFDEPQNFDKYPNHTPLFFTNATAKSFGLSNDIGDRVTVRANQGATYENVKLVISGNDVNLFNMSAMAIVAISRHRNECILMIEPGTPAVSFGAVITTSMRRVTKISPNNISPVFTRELQLKLMEAETLENQPVGESEIADFSGEEREEDVDPEMPPLEDIKPESEEGEKDKDKDKSSGGKDSCKDNKDDSDDDDDDDSPCGGFIPGHIARLFNRILSRFGVTRNNTSKQEKTNKNVKTDNNKKERVDDGQNKSDNTATIKIDQPVEQDIGKDNTNIPSNTYEGSDKNVRIDQPVEQDGTKDGTNVPVNTPQEDQSQEEVNTKGNNDNTDKNTSVDSPAVGETDQNTGQPSSPALNIKFGTIDQVLSGILGQNKDDEEVLQQDTQTLQQEPPANVNPTSPLVDFNQTGTDPVDYDSESLKYTPPVDNTCLLDCLAKLTVNSLDNVWMSMVTAIGKERALSVSGKPLSTDELTSFCNFNKISIMVVSDFDVVTCGIISTTIGTICHNKEGNGHFYLKENSVFRPLVLRLSQSENINVNEFGDQLFNNSRWYPTFQYAEQAYRRLSQKEKLDVVKTTEHLVVSNPITNSSIKELLGYEKPIENMTVKEITEIIKIVPLTSKQITALLLTLRLTKNLRFWNELTRRLIGTQPYIGKLSGGATEQTVGLTRIKAHTLKTTPPRPFDVVDKGFEQMARLFTDTTYLKDWLVEGVVDQEFQHIPLEQTPYDAFKMLVEDFATKDEDVFALTNQESIGYVDKDFGNGVFDMTTLDGMNQRRHPKSTVEKGWSLLNVAPGVTYYKSNISQSMHCLQARYLTRAYVTVFSTKSVDKAREIADMFFEEHMCQNYDIFNEQDFDVTTYESEHAMVVKNYHKQTSFEFDSDQSVRFSMKDIFKPFKTKIDLFKAGQGISAWSKDMQTIFQTSFRVINKHFINSLRPHVVYDNGIDEYELMSRINLLFNQLPSVAINGVIDATACDSGQNRFTQQIERRILERLGISDDFLDWYYQQRESYILKGYGVIARVKEIKTSGEPATLLNNTILMACLMNYIIRGEGPCVIVIKGDDGLKRQANMSYRSDVVEDLKNFLKMQFKVDIDIPITFCGYFLSGSTLLPDIVRKAFKIVGHKFRDYEHFCQYQQSLRDWVLVVNKLGLQVIVETTANNYKLTPGYCYHLFYAIVSLTHIGRKQFEKEFKFRTFDLKEDFLTSEPWSEKLPWYTGSN